MGVNGTLQQSGFTAKPDNVIPLLQYYQKTRGFISQDSVREIAEFLSVSEADIFGVASFYAQFRFEKPGDHLVRVCLGTACHVQSGEQLSTEIQSLLGIAPGEVTPDGRFEFQQVACLGCCAQAPLVEIDGKVFGKMTPDKLRKVLKSYADL
jgi:NADH-quinone oxidoreductase subunit E